MPRMRRSVSETQCVGNIGGWSLFPHLLDLVRRPERKAVPVLLWVACSACWPAGYRSRGMTPGMGRGCAPDRGLDRGGRAGGAAVRDGVARCAGLVLVSAGRAAGIDGAASGPRGLMRPGAAPRCRRGHRLAGRKFLNPARVGVVLQR